MVSGLGFKSWTIMSWFLCVTEDGGFFCVWLSHFEAVPSTLCIFGSFAVIEQNYVGFSWVLCFVDLCACLYGTPAFRLQSFCEMVLSLGMFLPVSRRSGRHGAVRCAAGTQRSPWQGDASAAEFTPSSHAGVKRNKGKRENAGFLCEENSANLLSESVQRLLSSSLRCPGAVWSRDAWRLRLCSSKWKSSDFSSVWTQIPIQLSLFICLHSCCILHFWNDYIQT